MLTHHDRHVFAARVTHCFETYDDARRDGDAKHALPKTDAPRHRVLLPHPPAPKRRRLYARASTPTEKGREGSPARSAVTSQRNERLVQQIAAFTTMPCFMTGLLYRDTQTVHHTSGNHARSVRLQEPVHCAFSVSFVTTTAGRL